jgi:integrase
MVDSVSRGAVTVNAALVQVRGRLVWASPSRKPVNASSASTPAGCLPPVIKFHAARHTAAPLAHEAGVDIKIVSEQLDHSTTRITQDLYQHVRLQVHQDPAEKVVELLPRPSSGRR